MSQPDSLNPNSEDKVLNWLMDLVQAPAWYWWASIALLLGNAIEAIVEGHTIAFIVSVAVWALVYTSIRRYTDPRQPEEVSREEQEFAAITADTHLNLWSRLSAEMKAIRVPRLCYVVGLVVIVVVPIDWVLTFAGIDL